MVVSKTVEDSKILFLILEDLHVEDYDSEKKQYTFDH